MVAIKRAPKSARLPRRTNPPHTQIAVRIAIFVRAHRPTPLFYFKLKHRLSPWLNLYFSPPATAAELVKHLSGCPEGVGRSRTNAAGGKSPDRRGQGCCCLGG